jgi:hypothetical protein
MLYSVKDAVCSEIYTKHINTLCGQNVEFVNVKPVGTYSDHWASERQLSRNCNLLTVTTRLLPLKLPAPRLRINATIQFFNTGRPITYMQHPLLI